MALQKVTQSDGSWEALTINWEEQCTLYSESLEDYATASMPVLSDLATGPNLKRASVYALSDGGNFLAACHTNVAWLPGYDGPVLRVRHITFSPKFDFDPAIELKDYEEVLVGVFVGVLELSYADMKADHVKFHLRSPAEQMFAQSFTDALDGRDDFRDVKTQGSWVYLSKT